MTRDNRVQAYTHTTVVDTLGGPPQPDQTILVADGVITEVGPSAQVPIPHTAAVTDLTGTHTLPGLTDMHVHSDGDGPGGQHFPALYIANGVTTVREMWGKPFLHDWRRRVADGSLLGPRSVIASPLVDGAPALWTDLPVDSPVITAVTAAQGRRAVHEAVETGADFVKVYSRLEREPYFAVLDEAHRRGITVVGHRSDNVPLAEQIDAGQRSFEHVHGLWPATSADSERLEAAMARLRLTSDPPYADWFKQVTAVEWEAVGSYSPEAAAALFGRLVAADAAYCPTLVMHSAIDLPDRIRLDDPRLAYLEPETPAMWAYVRDKVFEGGGRSAEEAARRRVLFDRRRAAVAAMDEAGVRLLAGTDSVTPGLAPGFSLHDELELLAGAGLSPLRALQAATIEPARFLGRDDRFGAVLPGRAADLVVLDADPLSDIRNTRRIHAVVFDGRFIGDAELHGVLSAASTAAAVR
ncbi:imidazolonepropionase-like amidohydrolase [Murinocardiopsis flavida]|uniref:Imidazolonepropionase-like amidohydrolase n=1 Tax=Murinocardiopsis flavida TaxID=645275 RepID=A0A2P8DS58_9ACTN|nr:amidohydrolase family protein [Murinocardiopsis flavida]PSL00053.1 imidazolonepropionase-like amidohydrolase [Murinocardiopsis flavida]